MNSVKLPNDILQHFGYGAGNDHMSNILGKRFLSKKIRRGYI